MSLHTALLALAIAYAIVAVYLGATFTVAVLCGYRRGASDVTWSTVAWLTAGAVLWPLFGAYAVWSEWRESR